MQYPKPQSRKLTFVPQLEGIEEVSEEEEEEEEEDDCHSTNDNNGVKREVREGGQQQNVHAGGDADCLAVVSEVHKDGAPLRPIVSLKGTPTYGLAKWLFRRLKFLTAESDTTVSSSAQFLEKLKGDLAIETIELILQNKYDETENRLGRAQVLQLLKFCLRTYFTFDGTIYEQVKGTPMGSPISEFIAEAVL
ncbi:hypothetical protein SprV_0902797700 [Sparganum proliferum]